MGQAKKPKLLQADDDQAMSATEDSTGRAVSRFNATRHGVLSKETVLSWEDRAEYDALHAALIEEFEPKGPIEAYLVEDLASTMWRSRRLRLAEAGAIRHGLTDAIGGVSKSLLFLSRQSDTAAAALADIIDIGPVGAKMPLAAQAVQQSDEKTTAELEQIPVALEGIEKALKILSGKSASKFERALAALEPHTQDLWNTAVFETQWKKARQKLEESPESRLEELLLELPPEPTESDFERWLNFDAIFYYRVQQEALSHREAIRKQAFADAVRPERLEKLSRYETHLDRKFERTLGMLIKVQEIRRAREAV